MFFMLVCVSLAEAGKCKVILLFCIIRFLGLVVRVVPGKLLQPEGVD